MEKEAEAGGSSRGREREELETLTLTLTLTKVAEVSSAVDGAKHVDEVICALHSLAALLFPVDSPLAAGVILDERCRNQILSVVLPTDGERNCWKNAFYRGSAFPTLSRILLYNVASKWLADFPKLARKQVYDSFFVEGPTTEIVQALVPSLKQKGSTKDDFNVICSNVESHHEDLLQLAIVDRAGTSYPIVMLWTEPGLVTHCHGMDKSRNLLPVSYAYKPTPEGTLGERLPKLSIANITFCKLCLCSNSGTNHVVNNFYYEKLQ